MNNNNKIKEEILMQLEDDFLHKKKSIVKPLLWITIILLVVLIFLIIFQKQFNSLFEEKFNPENDVCLKCYDKHEDIIWEQGISYFIDKSNCAYDKEFICKEFRPKTQCELNNISWKLDYECIEGTKSETCWKDKNNETVCGGGCVSKEICREKTQEELNQDYCNKYWFNEDKCECIEWKDYIISKNQQGGGGYSECIKAIPKEITQPQNTFIVRPVSKDSESNITSMEVNGKLYYLNPVYYINNNLPEAENYKCIKAESSICKEAVPKEN